MAETVVIYISPSSEPMYEHERVTLEVVARRIANLKGCEFGGLFREQGRCPDEAFYVPDEPLVLDEARRLGIRGPANLFGGVVPHSFVGTKAITHPLVDEQAERPSGWLPAFADCVGSTVLPGFTAFSARDARRAADRLLGMGPVRLKNASSCGGGGQSRATDRREVDAFVEQFPQDELATHGLVLETCLEEVVTRSVGQITICDSLLSYHGLQRTALNNEGKPVYGGSHLVCVQGGWDALDRLSMRADSRLAVAQARRYDAAMNVYPDIMATRRNYDVAQGMDGAGARRSGVLEAAWRSGGASTAELAALSVFMQDHDIQVVEACAIKQFGPDHHPPKRAVVHFRGEDPRDGPITRYTVVTRIARSA